MAVKVRNWIKFNLWPKMKLCSIDSKGNQNVCH